MMRMVLSRVVRALVWFTWLAFLPASRAQTRPNAKEIPLGRCDCLPVVKVMIDKTEMHFLVDTGATSVLNLKSFAVGRWKEIQITSWSGTAATSAREVSLRDFTLGNLQLRNLKLPAIDLSGVAKAYGGQIDGILGADLMEQLGVTLDLQRSVARLGVPPIDPSDLTLISEMETAMHSCSDAFNEGDTQKLAASFDRDFVLNAPWGEYRGREQAAEYIRERFFSLSPHARFSMKVHDQRAVGDVVWTSYDYTIESPDVHLAGQGMMLCQKSAGQWHILSMHETLAGPGAAQKQ